MGMRINGGGGGYAAGAQDAQWQQRRQNFDALAQAISGGDLSGANDAFAKIEAQLPAGASAKPNSFLDQIGAALQSGDIGSAQKLLAARINGAQTPGVDPTQQAGAVTAANATTAAGSTSGTPAASGSHGHRHHHHGGGGSSPAIDLSQAVQSGDAAKAQSAMQTLLTDLQQVADMGSLTSTGTSGAGANPAASQAITAANTLLQNPDFQALEAAVANGDASGMKSAWAKLVGAPASASTPAAPATPATPAVG